MWSFAKDRCPSQKHHFDSLQPKFLATLDSPDTKKSTLNQSLESPSRDCDGHEPKPILDMRDYATFRE